jgi:hypothetical protein
MLHSLGHASREWRHAQQWNTPSAVEISAGGTATYGLRLLLSPSLEEVEATLLGAGMPVAAPVPGGFTPLHRPPQMHSGTVSRPTQSHHRASPSAPAPTLRQLFPPASLLLRAASTGVDGHDFLQYTTILACVAPSRPSERALCAPLVAHPPSFSAPILPALPRPGALFRTYKRLLPTPPPTHPPPPFPFPQAPSSTLTTPTPLCCSAFLRASTRPPPSHRSPPL